MRYARLYADTHGESHFEEVEVQFQTVDYAPPAPPLELSAFQPASNTFLMQLPPGWVGDWHPSPQRQLFVVVSGGFEMQASDGEVRHFFPGDVNLGEDTHGKGHRSKALGDSGCVLALVHLA
jgi:quercetin dioxygenase-like cupin family protein